MLKAQLHLANSEFYLGLRSFYHDNKRVRNLKIKKILDWTPKYGNYKLGLKRILEI